MGEETVLVKDLVPHPANARRGNVKAVAESIRANGFLGAVVVQRGSMRILAGHHRVLAAKSLGMAEVPVVWADVDDATAERFLVADNRTSDMAGWDQAKLAECLRSLDAGGGLKGSGFGGVIGERVMRGPVLEQRGFRPESRVRLSLTVPVSERERVRGLLRAVERDVPGVRVYDG